MAGVAAMTAPVRARWRATDPETSRMAEEDADRRLADLESRAEARKGEPRRVAIGRLESTWWSAPRQGVLL